MRTIKFLTGSLLLLAIIPLQIPMALISVFETGNIKYFTICFVLALACLLKTGAELIYGACFGKERTNN